MKWLWIALSLPAALLAGPLFMIVSGQVQLGKAWYAVDRSSAGLAAEPGTTRAAIVEVYAARAFNWRGAFAVHTWIATKARDAVGYRVYQVTAWRQSPLPAIDEAPDRRWFGNTPVMLAQIRGACAQTAIVQIQSAAAAYPYAGHYRIWPGPNSNTFTAWMIRHVSLLNVAMPAKAIGKDYLGVASWARTPSATGYQVALLGLLGLTIARGEGLELNLLGLTVGINPMRSAIELPGIGRIDNGHNLSPCATPKLDMTLSGPESLCNALETDALHTYGNDRCTEDKRH